MTRVKIIPPPANASGIVKTQGTVVMVGDVKLDGVTKIVLRADVNDIWRAEIHCSVQMTSMEAEACVHFPEPWWRRFINWFAGNED